VQHAVSVDRFIDLEKLITHCPLKPIPVAPFAGATDTTEPNHVRLG
jgi:hypothetical protein